MRGYRRKIKHEDKSGVAACPARKPLEPAESGCQQVKLKAAGFVYHLSGRRTALVFFDRPGDATLAART